MELNVCPRQPIKNENPMYRILHIPTSTFMYEFVLPSHFHRHVPWLNAKFELPLESINEGRYIIAEYTSIEEAQIKLNDFLTSIIPNRKLYRDHPEKYTLYLNLLYYEIVETN